MAALTPFASFEVPYPEDKTVIDMGHVMCSIMKRALASSAQTVQARPDSVILPTLPNVEEGTKLSVPQMIDYYTHRLASIFNLSTQSPPSEFFEQVADALELVEMNRTPSDQTPANPLLEHLAVYQSTLHCFWRLTKALAGGKSVVENGSGKATRSTERKENQTPDNAKGSDKGKGRVKAKRRGKSKAVDSDDDAAFIDDDDNDIEHEHGRNESVSSDDEPIRKRPRIRRAAL